MTAKWDFFQAELRPQEWMKQAACKDAPNPDLWFPEVGDMGFQAKRICADCPVREECAEYGRTEAYGIWGGLGYRARKPIREAKPKPRAVDGEMCRWGHVMTPENTIVQKGKRYCRKCRAKTAHEHYLKKARR